MRLRESLSENRLFAEGKSVAQEGYRRQDHPRRLPALVTGMSRLDYQRTVMGYHGCDKALAESVLLGRSELEISHNNYDWLGSGVYFWEYGPVRHEAIPHSDRGA